MSSSMNRRDFIATSAVACVTATAPLPVTASEKQQQPSLCLSCRDSNLKETGQKDCWAALQSIGAEGVEAMIDDDLALAGLFHPDRRYTAASDAGIAAVVTDMKAAGKRISALCMFNRFDIRPEFEVQWCTKAARAALALGVKVIRIDVARKKLPEDGFLDFSVRTLKQIIAATESTGVSFAIENHGATTNNPEFLKPLLDRVGSPRLGVTLDTGNLYWFGHPLSKVYTLYELFAPYVRHTHCKSIRFPESEREKARPMGWEYMKYTCPIVEGDIDFHRVVKILRAADYTGDLCIEDESLRKLPAAQRGPTLAREIKHLKECL